MSEALLARLQQSLNEIAALDREHVRAGPFDVHIDLVRTTKFHSLALPDPGAGRDALTAALPALRGAFAERGRNARTEFMELLNPELEDVLLSDGWTLSERMPVMVCTPETFAEPPVPLGLRTEWLGPGAAEEIVLGFHDAQREAFADTSPVTAEEIARFRTRVGDQFCVAGLVDGEVVGTAWCSQVIRGITEVGGVATRVAFRGRGIAGSLTAAAVAAAFAAGAETAWLTAADAGSERIYARAGFTVVGTLLAYDAG